MGGKRISFTLTEDILKELAVKAKENGFISAPVRTASYCAETQAKWKAHVEHRSCEL